MERDYPTRRVVLGFVCAPSLTGLAAVLGGLLSALLTGRPTEAVAIYCSLAMLLMLGGLVTYGLPGLFIGGVCAAMRLHRSPWVVAAVAVLAGAVCQGWAELFASRSLDRTLVPTLPVLGAASPFVVGACVALVAALLLLPPALKTPADTATPPPDAHG